MRKFDYVITVCDSVRESGAPRVRRINRQAGNLTARLRAKRVTLRKRAVRGAFASSILSLLLLTTLVWGGCISCEQYFMWPGAKSCCSPNGRCKTKTPAPQNSKRECKQIAFDHQKSVDLHIDLSVIAAVNIDLSSRTIEAFGEWRGANRIEPSPPDLQVLNSIFLI
jgi:hypothetical protein